MCHFLELLKQGCKDCIVKYSDVFSECPPNEAIIEEFKQRLNIDITSLSWKFNKEMVSEVVRKEFEPLLKKLQPSCIPMLAMSYYSQDVLLHFL